MLELLTFLSYMLQIYFQNYVFVPADLLDSGIEPGSPALQADSLPVELPGKLTHCKS